MNRFMPFLNIYSSNETKHAESSLFTLICVEVSAFGCRFFGARCSHPLTRSFKIVCQIASSLGNAASNQMRLRLIRTHEY